MRCEAPPPASPHNSPRQVAIHAATAAALVIFVANGLPVAAETGLSFTHFNGMSGDLYYAEAVGSGAALLDYDNDGDLDVIITNNNAPVRLRRSE